MVNRVMIVGHLGADPQIRKMPSGDKVAQLRIATTERYKTRDGEKKEDTQWLNVEAWGQPAEFAESYLTKGRLVLIEGQLRAEPYEKDGEKRTKNFVRANRVIALGGGKDASGAEGASSGRSASRSKSDADELEDLPF